MELNLDNILKNSSQRLKSKLEKDLYENHILPFNDLISEKSIRTLDGMAITYLVQNKEWSHQLLLKAMVHLSVIKLRFFEAIQQEKSIKLDKNLVLYVVRHQKNKKLKLFHLSNKTTSKTHDLWLLDEWKNENQEKANEILDPKILYFFHNCFVEFIAKKTSVVIFGVVALFYKKGSYRALNNLEGLRKLNED